MPESFDLELSAHYKRESAREARSEAISDDLTALFIAKGITGKAALYRNGHFKDDFTLTDAINYACMHDDDDNWTVEEVEG